MAIKPTRTVKVRSLADRLKNAGVLLKRPGLKFIATLPTIKIKESTYDDMVLWKVELPKPVNILYEDYPTLNTFWVETIQAQRFDNDRGWYTAILIGIKKTKCTSTFIINPHEEDFYSRVKWWEWA